ncbi:MAG: acetyl-CoA carboxylase biotin carboxyl carrier protein [Candidatus Ventricola sp.]
MTNQEIFELMDRFERSSIRMMRLSTNAVTLEMSKDAPLAPAMSAAPAAPAASAAPSVSAAPAAAQESAKTAASAPGTITAPLAGVFYAAPAPGEAPFVRVGDRVKQGDTVCLMEAMKMISEIPAPCDCVITQVFKENGVLAGYGELLFGIQPC